MYDEKPKTQSVSLIQAQDLFTLLIYLISIIYKILFYWEWGNLFMCRDSIEDTKGSRLKIPGQLYSDKRNFQWPSVGSKTLLPRRVGHEDVGVWTSSMGKCADVILPVPLWAKFEIAHSLKFTVKSTPREGTNWRLLLFWIFFPACLLIAFHIFLEYKYMHPW